MVFRLRNLGLALAMAAVAGAAWAQGSQTGTLTGRVESADGQPLPGVTVAVSAPSLQGERTAVTTENGDYIFKGLPAGRYKVSFTLSGFSTRRSDDERRDRPELDRERHPLGGLRAGDGHGHRRRAVRAGDDADGSDAHRPRDVDTLATGRALEQIADLAPGLTDNTPNAGQVTIAGGFAYDNVFMLDGVDITDSTFGSPNDVFIEDAIEETQVITSGVSAEFGRFGGGVINAITKRGGNEFSGQLPHRLHQSLLARRDAASRTRQETTRESRLGKVFQATLGGPIVRDRLWFFLAGRKENRNTQGTFPFSGVHVPGKARRQAPGGEAHRHRRAPTTPCRACTRRTGRRTRRPPSISASRPAPTTSPSSRRASSW